MIFLPACALLGAIAYRVRGTAWGKWYGRVVCALLVSLPVLTSAKSDLAHFGGVWLYLPVVAVSLWAVGLPHDPSGSNWAQQAATGLAFILPCAVVLALLVGPGSLGAWLLVGAGLVKGLCYRLPEGKAPNRFLWREAAFGAVWGGAVGVAL